MRVLVIPEDFRKDQYVLKPLIEVMLRACGKPHAVVRVCQDPVIGGIGRALDFDVLTEVLDRYDGMVDLFLLIVDRDGDAHRRTRLDRLEEQARERTGADNVLAENAWQEIEVWVLAGHDLPASWRWTAIREEQHPKERYFDEFAALKGVTDSPGGGRVTLTREAVRRYSRIRARCTEDVVALQRRVKSFIEAA